MNLLGAFFRRGRQRRTLSYHSSKSAKRAGKTGGTFLALSSTYWEPIVTLRNSNSYSNIVCEYVGEYYRRIFAGACDSALDIHALAPTRLECAAIEQFGSSVGSACRESEESGRGAVAGRSSGPSQPRTTRLPTTRPEWTWSLRPQCSQSTVEVSLAHGLLALLTIRPHWHRRRVAST